MIDLSLRILAIMAPSILLAFVGVAWKKYGPEYPVTFVTTLVLNVAMPALIFHTLVTVDISLGSLKVMGIATLLVHVLFLAVAVLLLGVFKKDMRLSVAHVIGNTGNLGLPLCYFAFGQEGLAYAITFFAIQCVLLFTLGEAIYAGSAQLTRMLKVPIIYAIALALIVKLMELPVNSILLDTAGLLGQLVVPIMLITLGVSIMGMKATNMSSSILWSFVRTLVAIVVGVVIANLCGLEGVARGVLILETVVPVAVFNYLLATKHGSDSSEVSGLILITHLLAIVYLPFVLAYVL